MENATVTVLGAGAFGSALAVVLARAGRRVTLWGRQMEEILHRRESPRLAGVALPENLALEPDLARAAQAGTILLAVPAQKLGDFARSGAEHLRGKDLVACCKGIDMAAQIGPAALLEQSQIGGSVSILTGPSFAADIARGLPTALTLACAAPEKGAALQRQLSSPTLRIYLSRDVAGAELGGALKNVIAIACGVAIGAGLGESARAALMTRGFAEMRRLAPVFGADEQTLAGLSGLGDLALTCHSQQSRNFRFGHAIGAGHSPEPGMTVEGAATARALSQIAAREGLDLPICAAVAALAEGRMTPKAAMQTLMTRPLREEI